MKRATVMMLALLLCIGTFLTACNNSNPAPTPDPAPSEGGNPAPEFDPAKFIDWYNESYLWMTVENGKWSSDPSDRISDAELAKALNMAMKQQTAVHWTPYFFIVVKDVEEQRGLIGDGWGDPNDMATEGTVTVLVMADHILSEEEGHVTPYEGMYMENRYAPYDSGMASALFNVAVGTMGYYTHYFGSINGEYAPVDLPNGYQSMDRYVKDEYTRAWGFRSDFDGELDPDYIYPVKGNAVFVCAIVVGKPEAGTTVETWGTNHARPDNWAIWN